MRRMLLVLFVVAACGKGGEGSDCKVDADCGTDLRCGLLQGPDGTQRTMCVNPSGNWDMSAKPKGLRTYALPIGISAGALLLLIVMLRASVRAREKRKRTKS